jgi:hypothetical protein
MGEMILEQGRMVIDAGEVEMAEDVMMFYEDLRPQLEEFIKLCPAPG